jgi:hypothetical protein
VQTRYRLERLGTYQQACQSPVELAARAR